MNKIILLLHCLLLMSACDRQARSEDEVAVKAHAFEQSQMCVDETVAESNLLAEMNDGKPEQPFNESTEFDSGCPVVNEFLKENL